MSHASGSKKLRRDNTTQSQLSRHESVTPPYDNSITSKQSKRSSWTDPALRSTSHPGVNQASDWQPPSSDTEHTSYTHIPVTSSGMPIFRSSSESVTKIHKPSTQLTPSAPRPLQKSSSHNAQRPDRSRPPPSFRVPPPPPHSPPPNFVPNPTRGSRIPLGNPHYLPVPSPAPSRRATKSTSRPQSTASSVAPLPPPKAKSTLGSVLAFGPTDGEAENLTTDAQQRRIFLLDIFASLRPTPDASIPEWMAEAKRAIVNDKPPSARYLKLVELYKRDGTMPRRPSEADILTIAKRQDDAREAQYGELDIEDKVETLRVGYNVGAGISSAPPPVIVEHPRKKGGVFGRVRSRDARVKA